MTMSPIRWATCNCSAFIFRYLKNLFNSCKTAIIDEDCAWLLVIVNVVCPAFGLTGNTVEKQQTTGDSLVVFAGGKTDKKRPPVIDESNHPADQTAALKVLCRIASPSPLVLQFVKAVFRIGTVSIKRAIAWTS